MPGVRGFSGLMYLRAQYPSVPVVVVSANDDPAVIRRCMDFGASGFIPKTLGIEQMREAIKRVLGGGVWTPPDVDLDRRRRRRDRRPDGAARDADAAAGARADDAVGGPAQQADRLRAQVSEATVKAHVSAILQKLGVESRTQAVIAAAKIELGQWPQAAAT